MPEWLLIDLDIRQLYGCYQSMPFVRQDMTFEEFLRERCNQIADRINSPEEVQRRLKKEEKNDQRSEKSD